MHLQCLYYFGHFIKSALWHLAIWETGWSMCNGPCVDGVIPQQMTSLGANSIIPSLEVRSGSMQGPMVSLRANGVSLSLGFYSMDFRTVLEGSGILDRFGLLFSQSGGPSRGFPRSCAWASGLVKSRDLVSHGHVFRFEFGQVT